MKSKILILLTLSLLVTSCSTFINNKQITDYCTDEANTKESEREVEDYQYTDLKIELLDEMSSLEKRHNSTTVKCFKEKDITYIFHLTRNGEYIKSFNLELDNPTLSDSTVKTINERLKSIELIFTKDLINGMDDFDMVDLSNKYSVIKRILPDTILLGIHNRG